MIIEQRGSEYGVHGVEPLRSLAERHPDWPRLHVVMDFAPHVTAEDFGHFAGELAQADIWLPEGGNQDALERAQAYQTIADRDAAADPTDILEDYIRANGYTGTVDEAIVRALYGSRKPVGCADLTHRDLALGRSIYEASDVRADYGKGGYLAVRDAVSEQWLRYGRLQREREAINENRLEPELERVITGHPTLLESSEIRVLWSMGLLHSGSLQVPWAEDEKLAVSRRLPADLVAFGFRNELARLGMTGEGTPGDDLKDRAYLETVIAPIVTEALAGGNGRSSQDQDPPVPPLAKEAYLRDVVEQFSGSEIRMIFQNDRLGRFGLDALNRYLAHKGLAPVPTSAQALSDAAA